MNEVNRTYWDAMAAVHGDGADDPYDVGALLAGTRGLLRAEDDAVAFAVGDVAGRDVLHLQCHLGFDAVTLAQRGARVVGADFSPAALEKERAIAARAGVDVEYVEADSTALPESLHDRFDLVYATIGVLGWIDDLDGWMRSAAAALRSGGRLVLVEIHPLFMAIGSYADPDAKLSATRTVQHAHALGETITAALDAGLRVEAVREHLEVELDPRRNMLTREDDGQLRLRLGGASLPVLFTLVAAKP